MKIAKVTLICLIVLSNTLERTLKDQKHMSIAEKPFLRKLDDGTPADPGTTGENCKEGGSYIIVKYSEEVVLQKKQETDPEPGNGERVLQETQPADDSKIDCISTGGKKLEDDQKASEFQFYLKESIDSLENIFSTYQPTKITSLDFSNCKLETLKNLNSLFNGCSSLTSINFGGLKTEIVENMAGMFQNCTKLESVDLSQISTSSVKNMSSMFEDCSGLKSLNLSTFITSKVETMNSIFYACLSLVSVICQTLIIQS